MMKTLRYLSLLIGSVIIVVPPFILLLTSFKSENDYVNSSVFDLPKALHFGNFSEVMRVGDLGLAFWNVAYIAALAIIGNVALGTMTAYVLGRFTFRGRTPLLALYSLAAIIPGVTTQVATYSVVNFLHLTDTHYAMVLLYIGTDIIQIYVYLQFIRSIPIELDEAAVMDGASLFGIYARVMFPLLAPATATVIVLKTVAIYNDVYLPYLYMPSEKLIVISTALLRFSGTFTVSWPVMSAAVIVVVIPSLLVFLFLQRYIYAGIVGGSVK